ncbi:hypothetical protein NIES21_55420 [Anabaenopsis circularis NIES-21]|uniref:Putative restriction endonuclease domain-containing protein n=1 Tax=Anabaenopsis circularis NIES-21 TaxID=1085406 RepID=A0A1Z4GQB3_9CYAN|nr:hypothetical protein NIES21_55420 [Anabaenopsis circularis NIES-21]
MTALILNLSPTIELTDDQFFEICQNNQDLRFERSAQGEIIIMPPTGWESGNRNSRLNQRLSNWADIDGTGLVFDSSTAFILPNRATRSPDAAWVQKERITAINPDPAKFLPMAPDFVLELRSATDSLQILQRKMQEYIENGVRLGWLIDPQNQRVEIYQLGQEVKVLQSPTSLSGEDILLGFILDLAQILS